MRKNLKKLLSLVMTLSIVMSMLSVSVSAEETNAEDPGYEATDSYVLNYSSGDIEGYEEWDARRFYFSPYRTNIYVTNEKGGISNWNYCTASVLNMINTGLIDGRDADEPYASIPVYCVDAITDGVGGYSYRRANLEESTHFDDEAAGRVRAVIMNSFPYIKDMDDMTEAVNDWLEENYAVDNDLETEGVQWDTWEWKWTDEYDEEYSASYKKVENLNFYEVISATQGVIWTITNDGKLANNAHATYRGGYEGYSDCYLCKNGTPHSDSNGDGKLDYDDYCEAWQVEQCIYSDISGYALTDNTRSNINAVARYLEALEPMEPQNTLITSAAFGETEVVFTPDNNGTYTATITTEVNAEVYQDTVLTLTAVYGDKSADVDKVGDSTTVEDGENTYELTIENLPAPGTIYLAIDGVQTASDVFLFDPVNGRDSSQSMAGFDTSTMPVHAEISVTQEDENETVDINVTKIWEDHDDQDGVRPNVVTVQLKANGAAVEGMTLTLDERNQWYGSFADLPEMDDNGVIVYTIEEVNADQSYKAEITLDVGPEGDYDFTLTNCHEVEKTEVSVEKIWDDNNDQDGKRPESIEVQLLADQEPCGNPVTLNEGNDWTYTWDDIDKYKNGGTKIVYTVAELGEIDGYTVSAVAGDAANGYTITNIHEIEKISVSGSKVWDDENDYDGLRPESITVDLLANGEKVDSQTVIADVNGEWKWSFTDLDKYANGEEIKYSFIDKVDGYTATEGDISNNYTLTNTHKPEKVDVEGSKTWKDSNDQDGLRPESITINLLANGEKVDSKVVTSSNGWKWRWSDLDKYKGGKAINYTVTEDAVPGYSAEVKGYDVTNTHETEDTQITVKKVWKDDGNCDGIRPASISVQLLADGNAHGESVTLSAENGWSYTWTDLDKMSRGKEIKYSVAEISEVAGYVTTIDGFTITNTHEVEKISVSGSKTWNDAGNQDGKRPASITINLLADGEKIDSKVVTAADGWKWNFTGLNKNENGKAINYTITEDAVPGYSTEVNGYDVTNSYTPGKTSVTVNKVWKDDGNRDGLRPASISVQLFADGAAMGEPVTLTAESGWTYTWNGLDQMSGGKTISYSVAEVGAVAGYTSSVNGFTITNTHEVEKTSVSGSKTWNDAGNQDGKRPASITINLLADGEKIDSKVVTAADGWKWNFTGLNKNENGKAINYTITEDAVPGYSTEVNGYDVTNSYTPGKTSLTVNKVWKDDGNRDGIRPASISVQLLADGAAKGEPVTLTAENGWTYTWTGLDEMSGGKSISYSVAEVGTVAGYTSSVNGFTITNTHEVEKTSIDVEKVWERTSNPPEIDVIIKLLADGEEVKTLKLNEDNEWKGTFSDLPVNKDGKAITYTIEEVEVSGYTTKITGSAADGFTVTNTKEGDRPNDEEEEDEPSGGSKDVTYTLKADKTLDGKKANGFTFQVKDADGDVVATASAKSGKITFPTFRYDTEGTYTYTVSEAVGTNSNVIYDDSVYTLTVTVSKNGEDLVAACTGLEKDGEPVEAIRFENTYDGERFYDDDEEELFEEDIPLGGLAAPETGDAGMLWALTAAVSGMGLAGLNFFPKKRKEDEE